MSGGSAGRTAVSGSLSICDEIDNYLLNGNISEGFAGMSISAKILELPCIAGGRPGSPRPGGMPGRLEVDLLARRSVPVDAASGLERQFLKVGGLPRK